MTIDEAIKHAEKVAENQEFLWKDYGDDSMNARLCKECAEEHKQLAEWLKDYKRLLEQQPCEDCISRQKAIDTIDALYLDEDNSTSYLTNAEGDTLIGKYQTITALDDLPSVTPVFVLKTIKEKKNEINNFMESQSLSQHL